MRLLMAFRMAADVSVLAALSLLIGPFAEMGSFFALLIGLVCVGTYLSGVLSKWGFVKLLPLLLPGLALLWYSGTVHIIFTLVFTGYILFMAGGSPQQAYWKYKPLCMAEAFVVILAGILSFILERDSAAVCLVGAFQLLSSGFVLRQLRFGGSDGRGKMLDVVSIGSVLLLLFIIGLSVFGLMQNDFSFLLKLLAPFAWLLQQLVTLISGLSNLMKSEPVKDPEPGVHNKDTYEVQATMPPEYHESQPVPPDPFRWEIVVLVLGAILALYLIFRLLKWLKSGLAEKDDSVASLAMETEALGSEPRSKTREEMENVKKIRKVYRDYLKFLQGRGLFFPRSKTSLDVEEAAERSPQPLHAEEIRSRYIRVRYGFHEPDAAEIKEAKKLLREIKSQKKEQ